MRNPDHGQPCLARRAVEILEDQFGKWPLKAAAAAIGISAETWKNWRDRTSKPSTDHLSRLFHRLGPKFMAYVLAPFEESHLDLKAARLEIEIKKLEAELEATRRGKSLRAVASGQTYDAGALVACLRGKTET